MTTAFVNQSAEAVPPLGPEGDQGGATRSGHSPQTEGPQATGQVPPEESFDVVREDNPNDGHLGPAYRPLGGTLILPPEWAKG